MKKPKVLILFDDTRIEEIDGKKEVASGHSGLFMALSQSKKLDLEIKGLREVDPEELDADYILNFVQKPTKKYKEIMEKARGQGIPTNGSPELGRLCRDKLEAYNVLGRDHHVFTREVTPENFEEVRKEFNKKKMPLVVIKPRKKSNRKYVRLHSLLPDEMVKMSENFAAINKAAKEAVQKLYDAGLGPAIIQEVPRAPITVQGDYYETKFYVSPIIENGKLIDVKIAEGHLARIMGDFNKEFIKHPDTNPNLKLENVADLYGLMKGVHTPHQYKEWKDVPLKERFEIAKKAAADIEWMHKQLKDITHRLVKKAAEKEEPTSLLMTVQGGVIGYTDGKHGIKVIEVNSRPVIPYGTHLDKWLEKTIVPIIEKKAREHFKKTTPVLKRFGRKEKKK